MFEKVMLSGYARISFDIARLNMQGKWGTLNREINKGLK